MASYKDDNHWVATDSFVDRTGREVRSGDFIVYGHTLGRCAGLQFGRVLEIRSRPRRQSKDDTKMEFNIKVIGLDDHWDHREAKPNKKPGYLLFPERIVLLNDLMPQESRKILLSWTE